MRVNLTKDRARQIADLVFVGPDCSNCYREVDSDGTSWWCEGCGATWSDDGTEGVIEDPCPAIYGGPSWGSWDPVPCRKSEGHRGTHADEHGRTW